MIQSPLSAPISLQVELTDNCPNHCRHCYNFVRYNANGQRVVKTPIDMPKLETITDNIIRNEVFHVTLSGGEPALLGTKRLETIIKKYRDNNVQVSLNSSLSIMPDNMAEILAAHDVKVLVSIFPTNQRIGLQDNISLYLSTLQHSVQ